MEKDYSGNNHFYTDFRDGDWIAPCWGYRFKINHKGIKLIAHESEDLEKIIFDTEKKSISVVVKNPKLPNAPRTADVSENPDFFEGVRENIENILTTGDGRFTTVTPNEDRTVFTVSY